MFESRFTILTIIINIWQFIVNCGWNDKTAGTEYIKIRSCKKIFLIMYLHTDRVKLPGRGQGENLTSPPQVFSVC